MKLCFMKKIISFLFPNTDGETEQLRQTVRDTVHDERNFSASVIARQKTQQKTLDEATRTARNVIARLEKNRRSDEQEKRREERDDGKSI